MLGCLLTRFAKLAASGILRSVQNCPRRYCVCSTAIEPLSSNWYFPTHGFVLEALKLFRNSVLISHFGDSRECWEQFCVWIDYDFCLQRPSLLVCYIADEMEREGPVWFGVPDTGASGNLVFWTAVHNQGHCGLAQNGQEGWARSPWNQWGRLVLSSCFVFVVVLFGFFLSVHLAHLLIVGVSQGHSKEEGNF